MVIMQEEKIIRLIIGFDQREAIAYHNFCQSVIDKSNSPVAFMPLNLKSLKEYSETHIDGSNSFIYSRFLTPYLCGFEGWAIFADGDMICNADITELWKLRNNSMAVQCIKHDYKTKSSTKYLGNKNEDYPRKNWSSLVLWNCSHEKNKILTPEFVQKQTGAFLHRFQWLEDSQIGELPVEWNWLTTEYPDNPNAKLLHYTLGTPCFKEYKTAPMASHWHESYNRHKSGME